MILLKITAGAVAIASILAFAATRDDAQHAQAPEPQNEIAVVKSDRLELIPTRPSQQQIQAAFQMTRATTTVTPSAMREQIQTVPSKPCKHKRSRSARRACARD